MNNHVAFVCQPIWVTCCKLKIKWRVASNCLSQNERTFPLWCSADFRQILRFIRISSPNPYMTSNLTVEGAPFSISVMMSSSKRYVVHLGCQKIHHSSSVTFALVCSRGQCWPGITFFDTTRVYMSYRSYNFWILLGYSDWDYYFLIPFSSIHHSKTFIHTWNFLRLSNRVLKDSLILSITVNVVWPMF